jgi:ligand-binding SRPBCC domain-containing protein
MRNRLEFEQWVPYSLTRVFEFFSNPGNLPRLMPESSSTQLVVVNLVSPPGPYAESKAAGVGTRIVTSFRTLPYLPFRSNWTARITEFEWNRHFADVQDAGPFDSWHHRHEFRTESRQGVDGTLVRDVVEYEVGFGWLGVIADYLFVRRQVRHTFAERHKRLPQLVAS